MMTYENAFAHELAKLIDDAIERVKDDISRGWSVKDYSDYRYKVGQLDAFKAVLAAFDEADTKVSRR